MEQYNKDFILTRNPILTDAGVDRLLESWEAIDRMPEHKWLQQPLCAATVHALYLLDYPKYYNDMHMGDVAKFAWWLKGRKFCRVIFETMEHRGVSLNLDVPDHPEDIINPFYTSSYFYERMGVRRWSSIRYALEIHAFGYSRAQFLRFKKYAEECGFRVKQSANTIFLFRKEATV